MSGARGRVCIVLAGAMVATACSARWTPVHGPGSHASSGLAKAASSLSAVLTTDERKLAFSVVRSTARATRPRPMLASRSVPATRLWSSNVTRVVAAVGSLTAATAWKQPGTSWQLSDRREAAHPVLIVQMFGRFRFFRLRSAATGGPPVADKYDVAELTYVISTLDGARLSTVAGHALPDITPARTIFAR